MQIQRNTAERRAIALLSAALITVSLAAMGLWRELYLTRADAASLAAQNENLERMNSELAGRASELEQKLDDLEREIDSLKRIGSVQQVQHERTAYLTFDDGPSANTACVLDILKRYNVKATFFVCGNNTDFGKSMYRRIVNEGHAIGNHTFSHDYSKIYSSADAFLADMGRLNELIAETTGVTPAIMRFPGGSNNQVSWKYGGKEFMAGLVQKVRDAGYQFDDWNVSATDATAVRQDKATIVSSVLGGARGLKAAIILMHDSSPKTTTVEALPEIIEGLQAMGFRFSILTPDSFSVHFIGRM